MLTARPWQAEGDTTKVVWSAFEPFNLDRVGLCGSTAEKAIKAKHSLQHGKKNGRVARSRPENSKSIQVRICTCIECRPSDPGHIARAFRHCVSSQFPVYHVVFGSITANFWARKTASTERDGSEAVTRKGSRVCCRGTTVWARWIEHMRGRGVDLHMRCGVGVCPQLFSGQQRPKRSPFGALESDQVIFGDRRTTQRGGAKECTKGIIQLLHGIGGDKRTEALASVRGRT